MTADRQVYRAGTRAGRQPVETLSLVADDPHLSDDRNAELQAWGAGPDAGTPGVDQQSALTQDGRAREAFQQVGSPAEQNQALERGAAAKVDEAAQKYSEILYQDAEFDLKQKNLPQTPQNDATQGVEDFRYDSRAADAVRTASQELGEQPEQEQDEGLSRKPDSVRQAALASHPKVQQSRGPTRGDQGRARPAGRGPQQQQQARRTRR